MVNQERLLKEFQTLVSFDSESYFENDIKEHLKEKMGSLGLSAYEDDAGSRLGHQNPKSAGNLYGLLPGNIPGGARLFSAHMDTVSPGIHKKALVHEDGRITSDGTTVLGADDAAGIATILEALTVIQEKQLPHPDIEVLFSVAEEQYCKGAAAFDYSGVKAKLAYVLDLTGAVGTAALRAPSILSVEIGVEGKAAHAGFAPEEGVNALTIAANALSRIKTGSISPGTTVNFGVISGGTGKNVVPASVHISGEIRSLRHEEAVSAAQSIQEIFTEEAQRLHGEVHVTITEEIRAYSIGTDDPVVKLFEKAVAALDYGTPEFVTTFGGSDNNYLNKNGIHGIVIANAMEEVHTVHESSTVPELVKSAELTLALMTVPEDAT